MCPVQWKVWLNRYGDVLLAVVIGVALVVEVLLWDGGGDKTPATALLVLASAALVVRRTQPIPAFVVCWLGLFGAAYFVPGFDNGSSAFVVIYFLSLFSLGAHTHGREVAVSVLLVLIGIVVFVATDSDGSPSLGDAVFATVFVGGPWATGLALRLRRELAVANERLRVEQEEKTRRAIAEERSTIARELHDVVAHAISVTVLQSRGARRMLGRDEEKVRSALDAIEHTNTQALGDMRRLLAILRDTEGDAADRAAALVVPARRAARGRPRVRAAGGGEHGRRQPRRATGGGPLGVPDHPGGPDQRAQARRTGDRTGRADLRRGRPDPACH